MFNRYWRSYPWYFQLFQFLIMAGVMISFFGGVLTLLILKGMGYGVSDIVSLGPNSAYGLVQAARLAQAIGSIGLFIIVPLLFAYATHPRPAEYLGLRKPGKTIQVPLVILLMIGLIPVEIQISEWISQLPWSADIRESAKQTEQQLMGMMQFKSIADYLILLFIVAILPGIGEEMFFRGVMMRFAAKRFRNMWVPVIISALIFALSHPGNVFNYAGIFMAGAVLGIIYYRTGSLWMSALGHFVSNGLQVTLLYVANSNAGMKAAMEGNDVPGWVAGVGLIVAGSAFYLLWKNSTPLPKTWAEDYTAEELAGEQIK